MSFWQSDIYFVFIHNVHVALTFKLFRKQCMQTQCSSNHYRNGAVK